MKIGLDVWYTQSLNGWEWSGFETKQNLLMPSSLDFGFASEIGRQRRCKSQPDPHLLSFVNYLCWCGFWCYRNFHCENFHFNKRKRSRRYFLNVWQIVLGTERIRSFVVYIMKPTVTLWMLLEMFADDLFWCDFLLTMSTLLWLSFLWLSFPNDGRLCFNDRQTLKNEKRE